MRVDPERSSLTFVRPFLFEPEQSALVLARVTSARTTGRDGPMAVWEPAAIPTADWLPHIAESLAAVPGAPAIADCFRVGNQFFHSDRGLAAANGFEFVPKSKAPAVLLKLEALQLYLFRNGVGFVVQRWKVESAAPAVWLDLQHYGRFARLERGGQLRAPLNSDGSERSFPDPFLRRTDAARHRTGTFDDLNTIALDSAELGTEGGTPIRNAFIAGRALPYAVVFLTGDGDTQWPREKFLYKLRRLFHAAQTHHPTPEQEAVAPPNFHPYLKDQWFYFSLEGGGFAAVDAPTDDFFRTALPNHLETEYFLLFLLALQQRFSLMSLSADVARHWRSGPAELSQAELRATFVRIRDRLFDFTARYQFVQVVQRENHHLVYRLWREQFQTRELYDEVSGEVREMSKHLHDREERAREERVGRLTLLLTVMIGAPSLALGYWNVNINGLTVKEDGLDVWDAAGRVGVVAAVLAGVFAAVWYLLRRR